MDFRRRIIELNRYFKIRDIIRPIPKLILTEFEKLTADKNIIIFCSTWKHIVNKYCYRKVSRNKIPYT